MQENKLSEKFYKRLGFDVVRSDDSHSAVRLGNFEIVLVSMRDEEPFTNDAIALEKGRGMYIYVLVDDIDNTYSRLQKKWHHAVHRAKKLGLGKSRIHR